MNETIISPVKPHPMTMLNAAPIIQIAFEIIAIDEMISSRWKPVRTVAKTPVRVLKNKIEMIAMKIISAS